jgi:hypothetical protein
MNEKRLGFLKRRLTSIGLLTLCTALPTFAQRTAALTSVAGGRSNAAAADALHSKVAPRAVSNRPGVVLFTGDTVFAQVVDGGTWKTSFIISNLDTVTRHCEVRFFSDDGSDMLLPIFSTDLQGDVLSGVSLTIGAGGTAFFETAGTDPVLAQGWALLVKDNSSDPIGGMAVFRQRRPGFPDAEAVVPVVSQFDGHFVLIFDNTSGFVTGMAIANPSSRSIVATADVLDEFGNLISQETLSLNSYAHQAFAISDEWPSTAGRRGSIEFQTSGFGIGVLGLRFSPYGSFTSFNILTNFSWIAPGS